nr:MAG TPA: hypothetical protein [Caudoviricetes sp.]
MRLDNISLFSFSFLHHLKFTFSTKIILFIVYIVKIKPNFSRHQYKYIV